MTGYYLLNNGGHFHSTRLKSIRGIVLHITAGLEDKDMAGPDKSAEQIARYFSTTDRKASAHGVVDSDTIIDLLPDSATAFHVINYNGATLGLEICKSDVSWADEPKAWVEATLKNAAEWCRPRVERYKLPIQVVGRTAVDNAIKTGKQFGFTKHQWLDPSRRRDPGNDFPWVQFASYLRQEEKSPTIVPIPDDLRRFPVEFLFENDVAWYHYHNGQVNKIFSPATKAAFIKAGMKSVDLTKPEAEALIKQYLVS